MSNLLENLSPDEKKLLDAYDKLLTKGDIFRSDEEQIFDKLSLLGTARLTVNSSRKNKKIDSAYIDKRLDEMKKNPPDYTKEGSWSPLNNLIKKFYEAKKGANYDYNSDGIFSENNSKHLTPKGLDFLNDINKNDNRGTMNIINQETSGWIYRVPKNDIGGSINHRYALNVKQDKELLRKLDEFTARNNMYYKTCQIANWYQRKDAVVIYCRNQQTAKEIEELKKIAAPYIRRDKPALTNDLDGKLLADGIVTAQEVTTRQCAELYHKLNNINPLLAKHFKTTVDEQIVKNRHNPISLGQYQNYANLLDTFIAEKNKTRQQTRLRGQDLIFAAIDDMAAKGNIKTGQQKDSKTKHFGSSARQKAQEHMLTPDHKKPFGNRNNTQSPKNTPAANSWKTKLKKMAEKSLKLAQKMIKEIISAPYSLAKDLYKLPKKFTRPQAKAVQKWRNDPQRLAQVSLRYNKMLNRSRNKPLPRKDINRFIQDLRNGANTSLQQQNPQPAQNNQTQISLQVLKQRLNRQR